ncbi:MAG: type IIL restriction-modification enzyme MmeI, partial [Candidatus Nitrotoga sp.]
MTPQQFISKWQGCQLAERAFYQQHFNDLCALVGHLTPAAQDTAGDTFCFEKGATKTGGGNGWADVWKRGFFAAEYKGPNGDLHKALEQVQRYALALENPPPLLVARADLIEIHTNFTNTVSDTHTIALEEIGTPDNLAKLRVLFFEPEKLRPARTTRALTEQAAKQFASLATALRDRGHAPQQVAHFLDKLLFSFFAEDAGLLPKEMVTRVLENGAKDPARIDRQLKQLFASMSKGGDFGAEIIDWFNGGLFDSDATLPLQNADIAALITVARLDWT